MEDVDTVQPAEHVAPSVLQADFQHHEDGQIQAVSEESPSIQPSTAVYREENENLTDQSTVDQVAEEPVINCRRCAEHVAPLVLQADFQHDEDGQIQAVNDESPSIQPSTAVYRDDNENLTDQSTVDQVAEETVINCRRFYGGDVQRQSSAVKKTCSVNASFNNSPPRLKRKTRRPSRFD